MRYFDTDMKKKKKKTPHRQAFKKVIDEHLPRV